MAHSTSHHWIRFGLDPLATSPVVIAREAAKRVVYESRGRKGSFGLNMRNPLSGSTDLHRFMELVKVYVFEESQKTLFAKSVRLSHSTRQLFIDVVESNPERSRNYFERKITEITTIPHDVVQAATSFSVSFNTNTLHVNSTWYPSNVFNVNYETIPLFQLLVAIFTHEQVFPIWNEENGFAVSTFNPVWASDFFMKLYEHYLLGSNVN